jgi:hypothetical protein
MIAGLIEKLGVHQLGKNPMPAAADNRDGFYEDVTLVKISNEILQVSNSSWDVPAIASKSHPQKNNLTESLIQTARKEVFQLRQDVGEPWFIKDPRICLTVDEWKRILLLKTPLIFIVRNPHDVASSLMQRNNLEPRRALALWYRYNSALLRSVERDQILVLDYDMTCSKPGTAQARVESFLETVLSRGDNSVFEIEKQVSFNPRNFSRSIDFSDTKLHKESRDSFDLYRKISQFHLKMRLTTLKLIAEPSWVEEELNIAQREAFTQSQLAELNQKAEYLFTELQGSIELADKRDTELAQLRTDTEQERHKLETQLEELNHKAEYLFTELGESRDQVTQRDNELKQLRTDTEQERHKLETQLEELNQKAEYLFTELGESRDQISERDNYIREIERKIDCFDKEATRMSILLIGENTRNQELQLFAQRAEILEDYLTFFIDDCRRLTSKTTYRASRKVKMIFKFAFSIFSKNKTLKNDVLPIVQTTSEIVSEVIALDFQTHEYLLLNPDLKKCGINPISHYLLHGKNENRQLPIKTN